jgi:hypothetical protein
MLKKVKVPEKENKIDEIVISQAHNDDKWEPLVHVSPRLNATSIRLSPVIIEKAKLFAKLHHERGYQTWLKKIIEERIDNEYNLYKELKSNSAGAH